MGGDGGEGPRPLTRTSVLSGVHSNSGPLTVLPQLKVRSGHFTMIVMMESPKNTLRLFCHDTSTKHLSPMPYPPTQYVTTLHLTETKKLPRWEGVLK